MENQNAYIGAFVEEKKISLRFYYRKNSKDSNSYDDKRFYFKLTLSEEDNLHSHITVVLLFQFIMILIKDLIANNLPTTSDQFTKITKNVWNNKIVELTQWWIKY